MSERLDPAERRPYGAVDFGRVHRLFAEQFEADGETYLYRLDSQGPARRVSAAEREAFLAEFRAGARAFRYGLVAATLGALAGLAVAAWVSEGELPTAAVLVFAVPIGGALWLWPRLWTRPERALAGREG